MREKTVIFTVFWVIIFAIAMAFVESAVVVYLRALYYPEGFAFPLKVLSDIKVVVELIREAATIFMLAAVASLAGSRFWERFGYFLLCFGIWDIFYYIWLKVILDWPSSLLEWDVLFLIPLPWIGPVIAPVAISLMMILFGLLIIAGFDRGREFRPRTSSYVLALAGSAIILYSFMYDVGATLSGQMPEPYRFKLLITGCLFYFAAFLLCSWRSVD